MSSLFYVGLVFYLIFLLFTILFAICAKKTLPLIFLITFYMVGSVFTVAGFVDTSIQMNKAKEGYVIADDKNQIEVLKKKNNLIQIVENNTDTLVVTQRDWVNDYAVGKKVVNVKNF